MNFNWPINCLWYIIISILMMMTPIQLPQLKVGEDECVPMDG